MIRDCVREALVLFGLIKRPEMTVRIVDRHPSPKELVASVLIVVEGGGKQKWACFQCPGGCGNRFQLSLNPLQRPHWMVESDWLGRPTIAPSIHQKNSCRAHFWIKAGEVEWCPDSGHRSKQAETEAKANRRRPTP